MSKNLQIFDIAGSVAGEFPLEDNALEFEKGTQAVHDVVVAYLAKQRAGTASTKNRADVRGGGQKPFRQKGLGRARGGSRRSPIWTGGGVVFGPQPRDFSKKLNKKIRSLALKRAFSERVKGDSVSVLEKLELPDHKTKNVINILKELNIDDSVLLIVGDFEENVVKATGNIPYLLLMKADSVNVYQLLHFKSIIFTKTAIEQFLKRIG